MPKSLDKTKGARKRKKPPTDSVANTESDGSVTQYQKKKKIQKKRSLEGIEMSKQLAAEMQKKRVVRSRNFTKNNNEPRLLGNGKPMPSLAELEAMYADSDDDQDSKSTTETCSTPTQSKPIVTNEINLDSPETLMKLTSKAIDILSKKIELGDDDVPPPPVIPQKKPKKGNQPHIVGCKDRPQVPWAPKTKWCVGSDDFGIDLNEIPDEEEAKKRKKRGQPINVSKSIFNAKSDEIAAKLKDFDAFEPARTGSPDSNTTVEYDFPNNSPRSNMIRSFSPIPSTSRDSETIEKNDRLFNDSLQIETLPSDNDIKENDSQNDIEIIDIPCETIEIDDTLSNISVKSKKRSYVDLDDDCCILVEPEIKKIRHSDKSSKAESPPKDDIYGSIDLTQTFDTEVYEIDDDDIDNLIAENKAILEKDLKKNSIDTVTAVDPNVIVLDSESKISEPPTNVNPSTSNAGNSEVMCYPPGIVECVEIDKTDTYRNMAPTQAPQSNRSEEISQVLTNFFTCENIRKSNESTSTVDLTSSFQDALTSRLSSWMSSIESFLTGCQNRLTLSASNDLLIIDDSIQDATNQNNNVETNLQPSNISPRSQNQQRKRGEASTCMINRSSNLQTPNNIQSDTSMSRAASTSLRVGNSGHYPDPSIHNSDINQRGKEVIQPSVPLYEQQTHSQPSPPRRSLGDCPICMDSLANCTVASTMCGHVFCLPCIKAAIRANGKKCPTCRKALKGQGYHQLFI